MDALLAAASPLLHLACGLSSTSVPEGNLAFFLGGAAVAMVVAVAVVVFMVLGLNAWCFQFLTSGIVFDGSMSAILD
jgi:hypothetical protein